MRTNIKTIATGIAGVTLLGMLAACGSGLNSATSGGSGITNPSAIRLGSGSGTAFKDKTLELSSSSISAGGSATVTATLVDGSGTLSTTSTAVTFNSPCASSGQATITGTGGGTSSTVTATAGTAIATYTASGCKGSDTITATATINGSTLKATATISVASAALGSIQFQSATPSIITLKGMGGAGLQQTSTVIFTVKNAVGGPVQGANVTFALVSSTGGTALSANSATSDATGNVQTIVQAGTHSGPVVVQASIVVSGQTISTTSSGLAIQSGIPSQSHFSLSMDTFNVEGYDVDNNSATITASLADRFGNPVPDGTTVSFIQSNLDFGAGGRVVSSCNTASGTCSAKWFSQNPRPTDIAGNQHVGFAYVLAFANGEESFTDVNGDGVFDDYASGTTAEPFSDIAEIYAPSAEFAVSGATSNYVAGEAFYDFNSNGVHNNADGTWEGVNCQETVSGKCGSHSSTGVGGYVCIVMSGSGAEFLNPAVNGGAATLATLTLAPTGGTVSFDVADENGNVPPSGTIISVDTGNLTNGSATISPTNSSTTYKVGNTSCENSVAGWPLRFVVTVTPNAGATGPMSGTVSFNVATPGGVVGGTTTSAFITVP